MVRDNPPVQLCRNVLVIGAIILLYYIDVSM